MKGNWQPIETAPSDRGILTWDEVDGICSPTKTRDGKWMTNGKYSVEVFPTHWHDYPEPPGPSIYD